MLEFLSNLYNFIFPEHNGIIYAIDPLTIGLIAGGAQALIGGIGSIGARRRLRSLEGQEPKYEIPQEVFQATKQAQEMAQTGMPEASRMMALQGAQQAAIFRQRAAGQSRLGQANVATNETLLSRDLLNVAQTDAQVRLDNQRRALQALMVQAQYRDKAFGNQWQSWMNKFQQARANVGAKERTMYNGFDTMSSMFAMGALGGGAGKTPSFGGTDLTTVGTGVTRQPNQLSGISAIMGTGTRPPMPGMQRPTPNYIPTANMPFYQESMQDLFSQPIGQ